MFRAIGKCLKPGGFLSLHCHATSSDDSIGGLLLAADGNRVLFDDKQRSLRPADLSPGANNDGCSYMSGWMAEIGKRKSEGINTLSGEDQAAVIRLDGQFKLLGERDYFAPIGWDDGEVCAPNGKELSQLWSVNLNVSSMFPFGRYCVKTHALYQRYLHASKGILLSSGETTETVDGWIADVMGDVPPRIKILFKYSFFWARKV